jgi:glycosyltransferase involved in cell wall biosynthesis
VSELRRRLLGPAGVLVGYFGGGGAYAERALELALAGLARTQPHVAVVCFGRGSGVVAARLARALPKASRIAGAGEVPLSALSHHLQACDVLMQPYEDGVSGRRTTTISALEHGVPVATTSGVLSEAFWTDSPAVALAPAERPAALAAAAGELLAPARHRRARAAALDLYRERFDPGVTLAPLFDD